MVYHHTVSWLIIVLRPWPDTGKKPESLLIISFLLLKISLIQDEASNTGTIDITKYIDIE